jgi:putative spermidine/putrescine transport system permease protein
VRISVCFTVICAAVATLLLVALVAIVVCSNRLVERRYAAVFE